jgi:hypothetical protein
MQPGLACHSFFGAGSVSFTPSSDFYADLYDLLDTVLVSVRQVTWVFVHFCITLGMFLFVFVLQLEPVTAVAVTHLVLDALSRWQNCTSQDIVPPLTCPVSTTSLLVQAYRPGCCPTPSPASLIR